MSDHDYGRRTLRNRMSGVGRFARISLAAAIVVVGAGILQASSSSAANGTPPPTHASALALRQQAQQLSSLTPPAPSGYKQTLEQQIMQIASTSSRYHTDFGPSTGIPVLLQRAVKTVDVLNDQQLAQLYASLSASSALPTLPANVVKVETMKAHALKSLAQVHSYTTTLRAHVRNHDFSFDPAGVVPVICTALGGVGAIAYAAIAVKYTTAGLAAIGGRVADAIPDSLTVVILGEGVTIPDPVRIVIEILNVVLETVSTVADAVLTVVDECSGDKIAAEEEAYMAYSHQYQPLKTLTLKVVPTSTSGLAFIVTGSEDGAPVQLILDTLYSLKGVTTPGTTPSETPVAGAALVAVDAANGVYSLTIPASAVASGYVLKAESAQQTDPQPLDAQPTQTHTGVVTFTKSG